MLSDLITAESIEVFYSDVVPTTPVTLEFPSEVGYQLVSVTGIITSGAAICIPIMNILDDASNFIVNVGLIPWQFPATTVFRTITQAPNISTTALFGPAVSGFISSGLTVFNGWQIQFVDFIGTPGVSFDGALQFTRTWDNG